MVSGGTVTGDLSSLKTCAQNYSSEISGLAGAWQGDSYNNLVSKAEEFISEYSSALEGEMTAFASACDLYKEYEQCKQNLSTAQSNYNTAVSNKDSSAMTSYGNQVATYQTQLANLKSQIEGLLASASAVKLQATSASGTVSVSGGSTLGTPTYGTFEHMSYKASNGKTVDYYLYVPNYGNQNVSGLPIHVYMHGSGETGSGVLRIGLPKIIQEQRINPSGLVLCLQAHTTKDFYDKNYQAAVVELTQQVAKNYGGDTNRISLSGHSMGAIAGYKMIGNYPNTFSAFVPISGVPSNLQSVSNVKTWAFHGSKDSNCDYNSTVSAINKLQQTGASAYLYTFQGKGHGGVQNYTFEDEYEDETGQKINPLEWAFKQTKSNTQA